MSLVTDTAIDYFSAREHYFWRWAEHGRVIEFANKRTICYREDLSYLLAELGLGAKFPLGSILLLLCACKDNWEQLYEVEQQMMRSSLANGFNTADYQLADTLKKDAYALLKIVNALPYEARSGIRRTALIQTMVDSVPSDTTWPLIKDMLSQLNTGELDYTLRAYPKKLDFDVLRHDLSPLAKALAVFSDTETLALKLKTGLMALPEKVPVGLPENEDAGLLEQLEDDVRTHLLGTLTRKILAAIRIPMHLSGTSDYSLGGVADISNRGQLDKLLLSELAQDDVLLSARLAHNEALYLQREIPPDQTEHELGIFMDATLKMWGMPRVLALATALAFREGKQNNQHLQVWALGGRERNLLDLDSKKGVVAALETLDPSLNCSGQLYQAVKEQTGHKGKYILISGEEFLQEADTAAIFHRVRDQLNFLVTVRRDGYVRLFQLNRGRQKLLNQVQIDLSDHLYRRRARPLARQKRDSHGLPAIFQVDNFPLYYPTSKVKVQQNNTHVTQAKEILVVTQDRRLLYWPDKNHGAIELIDYLVPGAFCFAESNAHIYVLLASNLSAQLHLYTLDLKKRLVDHQIIEPQYQTGYGLKFIQDNFYLFSQYGLEILNPETLQFLKASEKDLAVYHAYQPLIAHFRTLTVIKRQINNGYSVINSAQSIYVHTAGLLFMDKRRLQVEEQQLVWKESTLEAIDWVKAVQQEPVEFDQLPNIKFTRFSWANGSEALLDSRGLLHLKSINASIPDICIWLVVDRPAACWSADGVVSGSAYFTDHTDARWTEPSIFYKNYIERFIDALKS
ncbi:hypothetical protein [Mucilaginibacter sp. 22184]|uniref:hypothetical protein n=1 Tax=Mucilaginibacter sp. 22184 TaxID=3453887 RepID=UPI003F836D5E